jgi:hypothetical protein
VFPSAFGSLAHRDHEDVRMTGDDLDHIVAMIENSRLPGVENE